MSTPTGREPMPMFPLGTVLLPAMLLSLQVFEERYLTMLADMRASGRSELGVVLIERGSEVGGGDVRVDVGCIARIVEARRITDGRWAIGCIGDRRIEVLDWLPDDPYPRAIVRDLPDLVDADRSVHVDAEQPSSTATTFGEVESLVVRVAALASELGAPGLPELRDLDDDPVRRSYQLGVLSPLGALDRQQVLAAAGVSARLHLLRRMLLE
ncbi:MAG: LON peptidase substrate-binding domain-containing protein, partial [Actinobacteria bacterium]|nr:LON peptidase substrate-binding domain-containing protein [Actinomycetota bacterium]